MDGKLGTSLNPFYTRIQAANIFTDRPLTMPIDKKRKLSKSAAVQSKRRKTLSAAKKQAHVDSLRWKSVEVPEGLDDFEGFYGLEEIEGVEVVKEGDAIKFVGFFSVIAMVWDQ